MFCDSCGEYPLNLLGDLFQQENTIVNINSKYNTIIIVRIMIIDENWNIKE